MRSNPLDPATPLPHDEESEKKVLAACMDDGEDNRKLAMTICMAVLTPESFYIPVHASIWKVMVEENAKGTPLTRTTLVLPFMAKAIRMSEIAEITSDGFFNPGVFQHALSRIVNAQTLRAGFAACYAGMKQMADPLASATQSLATVQSALSSCVLSTKMETGKTLKQLWGELIEQMQNPETVTPAILTGIRCLDDARVSPRKGQLVLLGALRHVGKTALARQLALNAGNAGHKVLCFFAESADMDEAINTMAASTGKPTSDFTKNPVQSGTVSAMAWQMGKPVPNIRIDTEARLTVDMIEMRSRYLKQTEGLDVIFCDNLQYFACKQQFNGETREQSLSNQALRLKYLARELGVVIYLLVQLNDTITVEETPEISTMRESKGPAGHADCILLMSAPYGIDYDQTGNGNALQTRYIWNRKFRMVGAHSKPFELKFDGKSQRFIS